MRYSKLACGKSKPASLLPRSLRRAPAQAQHPPPSVSPVPGASQPVTARAEVPIGTTYGYNMGTGERVFDSAAVRMTLASVKIN